MEMKPTGMVLIGRERREQVTKHGRTVAKDVEQNKRMQLSFAAALLCAPDPWQFTKDAKQCCPEGWDLGIWRKMLNKSYQERLIIAGALIAAEIDRLNA